MKPLGIRPSLLTWIVLASSLSRADLTLAAPPANDSFVNATLIAGSLPLTVEANNIDATLETGETPPILDATSTVWFTWTAPQDASVSISTAGTAGTNSIDSVVGVYTGDMITNLALIGANDDATLGTNSNGGKFSFVGFNAASNTTYRISVGGIGNTNRATGEFRLIVAPRPGNDNFAEALVLPSVASNTVVGTTEGASKELSEPQLALSSYGRASVWFQFVPPTNGAYVVEVVPSAKLLDPLVGVYTGTNLSQLTRVARGANASGFRAGWNAQTNVTYSIQLDGNGPVRFGDYELRLYGGTFDGGQIDTNRVAGVEIAIRYPRKDGTVVTRRVGKPVGVRGKVTAESGISLGTIEFALSTNQAVASTNFVEFERVKIARKGRTGFFRGKVAEDLVGPVRIDVRATVPSQTNYSQDFTRLFEIERRGKQKTR